MGRDSISFSDKQKAVLLRTPPAVRTVLIGISDYGVAEALKRALVSVAQLLNKNLFSKAYLWISQNHASLTASPSPTSIDYADFLTKVPSETAKNRRKSSFIVSPRLTFLTPRH